MDSIIKSIKEIIQEHGEDLLLYRSLGPITLYRSSKVEDLKNYLSSKKDFSCFDEKYQQFFNVATRVDLKMLIIWMVRRAIETNAEIAVNNVIDYINTEEIDAYHVMILSNMVVTREYKITSEISLIPIHLIPDENIQKSILDLNEGILSLPKITGALIRRVPYKKCHYTNEDEFVSTRLYFDEFEDIRYCFSILNAPGRGLQSVGTSIITSREVPLINGIAWNLPDFRQPPIGPGLIDIDANRVIKFYELFCNLDDKNKKAKIRVALKLMNNYESTYNYVEKSMFLRTALEAIFLNKQVNSIKQVLSAKVGSEFTNNVQEKEEISNIVKKVYKITSEAIHNGMISDANLEITYKYYPIAMNYILKKIENMIYNS